MSWRLGSLRSCRPSAAKVIECLGVARAVSGVTLRDEGDAGRGLQVERLPPKIKWWEGGLSFGRWLPLDHVVSG